MVPMIQVANVTVPEPRLLSVQVWDRALVPAVDKAIRQSHLGLNPIVEGQTLRIPIPELTEDRRKEMIKLAHVRAEEGRVAIRAVRRHAKQELEKMKKDGTLPEDEERSAEAHLQKLTDKYVHEVDENLGRKEAELSEV